MNLLQNSKPLFRKGTVPFQRKEKEGYWTIVSQFIGESVVNFTAKEVLDSCDGQTPVAEIVNSFYHQYPDAGRKTIERDIVKTLSTYSRLLIIEWDGPDPFVKRHRETLSDGMSMEVAHTEDIQNLLLFINNNGLFNKRGVVTKDCLKYTSPVKNEENYKELELRKNLFSLTEDFFLLKNGESIKGLVSFEQNVRTHDGFAIGRIGIIYCPRHYLGELLLFGRTKLPFICSQNLLKLQFDYNMRNKAALEIKEILRKQSWDRELILMNEYAYSAKTKRLEFFYSHSEIKKINARRKNLFNTVSLSE